MRYQSRIHDYVYSKRQEIVSALTDIVRIPSVKGEPQPGAPFGKACADVMEHTEDLYRKNGFDTELHQDRGYLLSYYGSGEKTIGLFAHADVVPAGDDWILTSPFDPVNKDGFLIGRGTSDDKSGVIISLYTAKIMKELGIPLNHRLLMFTGVNEESGMRDIRNYVSENVAPQVSLVIDTAFPCYNGDKAVYRFWAKGKNELRDILEVSGGDAFNIVLGRVKARLKYSESLFKELKESQDERVSASVENGEILVITSGKSTHAALPEGSVNAAYILFTALAKCKSLCESDRKQAEFLSRVLGEYYGACFGINQSDEQFGCLTCVNGIVKTENGFLILSFDSRFSLSVNVEEMENSIRAVLDNNGFCFKKDYYSPAFYISEDDQLVKTVLSVYHEFTGNKNAKSRINAGGTYAKYLPYALETGTSLWHNPPFELPQGHGGVHQPDEFISIEGLLEAIELTAQYVLAVDELGGAL